MSHKLYARPGDARSNKILIAAKFANGDIKTDPDFKFPQDCRKKDFKNLNPIGKVPVLDITSHGSLWESNAILRFIGRHEGSKLYGSTPYEAALIDQWLDFSSNEVQLPADAWLYPIWEFIENNPGATAKAQSDIRRVLAILNTHLINHTFLVGERISLADIALAASLAPLYVEVLDEKTRKPFFAVNRWFKTCTNQHEFTAVLGALSWCVKPKQAPAPKGKEEPKKQAPKQQQQQQKKEVPAETDDGDDPEVKEEKRKPNPLDSLPPSKFVLDEWKRVYSNEETTTSLPWLWEHFDEAGWSIWFGDYKYNSELGKMLSALNFAGGFIQRLDKFRKYSFASMIIFGEEPNLELSICFLWRSLEIPEVLREVDDCILYEWRKADIHDPATKKLIEEYFTWAGDFGGKHYADGKIFK